MILSIKSVFFIVHFGIHSPKFFGLRKVRLTIPKYIHVYIYIQLKDIFITTKSNIKVIVLQSIPCYLSLYT